MSPFYRLYYSLKPLLPSSLRLRLRRALARRQLRAAGNVWPIDERAGRTPEGWPGWPDGKQFALVLTHDVEGPRGLERCKELAELEMSLGFRSCFNFIPEGPYTVPPSLRDWLTERGFEVGVHDLHHDGKLYRSREVFRQRARKINRYLKDWGAVGFRSGFMLHNLDWLHDLNVMYDSSTFDTDPFEPQPDGVRTIFPFWVERPRGQGSEVRSQKSESGLAPCSAHATPEHRNTETPRGPLAPRHSSLVTSETTPHPSPLNSQPSAGYLELPYTLAQDSTLLLFLGERTIEIWKKKLDWVTARGGMALLNVHPDYLAWPAAPATASEVPVTRYREFLEYAKARYAGVHWHVLPREVAGFCARVRPRLKVAAPPRRVCMISHSFYRRDSRIIRYSEALAARGDWVDVVGLWQDKAIDRRATINGVHVLRLQLRPGRDKGKWSYLFCVLRFLVGSSCLLSWRHLRRRYDVVHVHNVPDFLVCAAWLPRLTGAKVILDIHDLLPEFYANKYNHSREEGAGYKLALVTERASARSAHHVIISNHLWYDRITRRSVPPRKCSVFLNYLDENLFYPRTRRRKDGRFVILFPGGLYHHQGLDLAIRAFAAVRPQIPGAEFHIYGDGDAKGELIALARDLGLNGAVHFREPVPLDEVPDLIANADLGVVPKRADLFGNEAYSTKIVEFMSQGVPVIVARTKIDTFYFNEHQVCFFEPGNVDDLAAKIRELAENKTRRETLARNGLECAAQRTWGQKKQDYLDLVDRLCGKSESGN